MLKTDVYLQLPSEAKSYVMFHSEIHHEKFLSDPPDHMQLHSEKRRNLHFHEMLGAILYEEVAWGSVVVKALRYYSDGLGIDSRCCH